MDKCFYKEDLLTLSANYYNEKFEMPHDKIYFQELISGSEPVKAIFASFEFAMPWTTTLFDDLILKGEELRLEIEKYLVNK